MNVEWRIPSTLEHFGSTEIKGGGAPAGGTIIYRHPAEPDGSIASPSANWAYNHADGTTTPVRTLAFDLHCSGAVSFDRFSADHGAYTGAGLTDARYRGQERANTAYTVPIAGYLQNSGEVDYECYLVGAAGSSIGVSVTMHAFAVAMSTPNAQVGGSRSIQAEAKMCVPSGELRARAIAKPIFPVNSKQDAAGGVYQAVIPASGELKIGASVVGIGFNVIAGTITFVAVARTWISFFEPSRGFEQIGC